MSTITKLKQFIDQHKIQARLIQKPSTEQTMMAQQSLELLGFKVDPEQMIKALVCIPIVNSEYKKDGALLAMISGPSRLSLAKLQKALNYERIVIADQKTAEMISGYPRGGTPPIGHESKITVVMDEGLSKQPLLYGGGGTTEYVLEITPAEIIRVVKEIQKEELIVVSIRE